jgi:hypothetical protein
MRVNEHNSTRGGRLRARRVCVVVAALSLSATSCAQDPQKETRQEAQTLASWAATLHMVGDSWREGSVPSQYARKTFHETRKVLQKELKSLQESSTMPADARAALAEHAQKLDGLAGAMWEEVQTGDPTFTPKMIEQAAQEEQSLKNLAQQAGAQGR